MEMSFTLGPLTLRSTSGSISVQKIGFTAVFDLNGDGYDDILGAGGYPPNEPYPAVARPGFLILGSPDGFTAAAPAQLDAAGMLDVNAREIVFADFNEDGVPDFYIADHGYDAPPFPGQQNRLYLSTGPASWSDATSSLPQIADFTHSATTGDVNADGHQDIFVGNGVLNAAYILLGDGDGHFTKSTALLPTGPGQPIVDARVGVFSCLIADLDDDGLPELVLGTAEVHSEYQVLWNTYGGYASADVTDLPSPQGFGTDWVVYDIQSMDVNFDGLADLVVAYVSNVWEGGWCLQVLVNHGQRNFTDETATFLPDPAAVNSRIPTAQSPLAWIQFLIPRDLNADGRMDFVVDTTSMGGVGLPDNIPVALIHQANGVFAPITIGALREQGMPDSMLWNVKFVSTGSSGAGEFQHIYYSPEGRPQFDSMPVTFAPAATFWVAGTSGNDTLVGTNGPDAMAGFGGDDRLQGDVGIDTAVYSGARNAHTVTQGTGNYTVARTGEGTDTLVDVERLQFSDSKLALDLNGNAGSVAKILGAIFGLPSVSNTAYVGIGLGLIDSGMAYADLMQLAINVALPSRTSAQFVDAVYFNVIGIHPDAGAAAPYVALLEDHTLTQAQLAVIAADSNYNTSHIDLTGLAQHGIAYV
ncbi:MAG: repeat protein [Ramlibacter sp.]|nr:repeat protein [Ramlibacter sp.]